MLKLSKSKLVSMVLTLALLLTVVASISQPHKAEAAQNSVQLQFNCTGIDAVEIRGYDQNNNYTTYFSYVHDSITTPNYWTGSGTIVYRYWNETNWHYHGYFVQPWENGGVKTESCNWWE